MDTSKLVFLLLVFLLLSSCSHYTGPHYQPEVTVLFGPRDVAGDTEPGIYFGVMQRIGRRSICGYVHGSDPNDGRFVNREAEMTFDQAGCGWRFGGEPRGTRGNYIQH